MNYRHIFHAGNACDVVKHAILALLIERLRDKDKPFCLLDTHAGIGLYDLRDPRAQKTGEAETGILRFLAAPLLPELAGYYNALRGFNPDWQPGDPASSAAFRFYPGSPLLAARLARPQDRIVACELHEDDAATLKHNARLFANLHIHRRDGFEALRALLPPEEKRGLVLIDPPYEAPDEFERILQAVADIHRRWPQGGVMIWYPVKDRPALWRFHEKLAATGVPGMLCAEFVYAEETRHDQLNGCGFIFVNPPWQLHDKLRTLFSALHEALQSAYTGVKLEWLTSESAEA